MPNKICVALLLSAYVAATVLPSVVQAADGDQQTADQSQKKKKKGSHDGE